MPTKIFADFNNSDEKGRVRLNANGTLDDIRNKQMELVDGLEVLLDDDDGLVISGQVEFSKEENIWVAVIDWSKLKR